MQELLYSEYLEKNGLATDFARGALAVPSGSVLVLDENNKIVRYTHARIAHDPLLNTPTYDPVAGWLKQKNLPEATVVARVEAPHEIAHIDKTGKITVTDQTAWIKHGGLELLNCYEVKGSDGPPNFTPDG
jgi:hypothetical protein